MIGREDLIHAIDRTTFIKNDNMTINRLQCSKEEVILTNKSQEIGESHETLNAEFTGEPLDISFSGTYVMDAAKALRGSQDQIQFTGEMKPFILSCDEDNTILQLVLPVRTYN
jgi:DNA polymerase-3 subunit beta